MVPVRVLYIIDPHYSLMSECMCPLVALINHLLMVSNQNCPEVYMK